MSIEGQGHFFTIYFPGFVCFVLYLAKISGERLQDHWSSGFFHFKKNVNVSLFQGFKKIFCTFIESEDMCFHEKTISVKKQIEKSIK